MDETLNIFYSKTPTDSGDNIEMENMDPSNQ